MADFTDNSPEPPREAAQRRRLPDASHADKYGDPRARVTARGVWLGLALLVAAAVFAGLSIHARRTRLAKSTEFWGETTIKALQLADQVHLLPAGDTPLEPVELTAVPGLGHLRRALLDERHFLWQTASDQPVSDKCRAEEALCVRLRLADPSGQRVPPTEILLELNEGWVGPADGSKRVRANPRVQRALRYQLMTWMNVQPEHYDLRGAPSDE